MRGQQTATDILYGQTAPRQNRVIGDDPFEKLLQSTIPSDTTNWHFEPETVFWLENGEDAWLRVNQDLIDQINHLAYASEDSHQASKLLTELLGKREAVLVPVLSTMPAEELDNYDGPMDIREDTPFSITFTDYSYHFYVHAIDLQ